MKLASSSGSSRHLLHLTGEKEARVTRDYVLRIRSVRYADIDLQPDVGIQQGNHIVFAFLYFHSTVRPTPTTAGALIPLAREELSISEGDEVAVMDIRERKATMALSSLFADKTVRELDAWFGGRSR